MVSEQEIEAVAAVLKANALDIDNEALDDLRARRLARLVLDAAAAVRPAPTVPAFRADG